jgi:GT2 family glycosyltransferase
MSRRMTSPPDSPVAPPTIPTSGQPAVAVVVLAENGAVHDETLAALARQVYVPAQTLVVGAGGSIASTLKNAGHEVLESAEEVLSRLSEEIAFVWFIHGDTRPRPDSLVALVQETVRNDASIAGSKILIAGEEDQLDSVGEATDVFGEPYSGVDPGELDLEQYDVVREVAFVSPVSLLVRKDLLSGLRGLDTSLPLEAAGLDFSQRGRLAGGRVIVVPSSEVFHPSDCSALKPGWRQLAGRQKAMLNAYRPITLAWVLPVGLLVGLVDGIGQLILGRFRPLAGHLLSWIWNLVNLPSSVSARRALARIRLVADEELFRFQVKGSVRIRRTLTELTERFSRVIDQEENALADRAARMWQRPTVVLGVLSALALVVGTRQIWFAGTPHVGFGLPSAGKGLGILSAYGGGWHAAGLGSPMAAPPVIALAAVVEMVVGGDAELALSLLTLTAIVAGLVGASRMAKRAGASALGGQVAAWIYVAGSAAAALAGAGQWPLLVAMGPLPWALDAVLAPGGQSWRRQLGRIGRGGLAAGLTAIAYPPLLVVIPVVAAFWALFSGRRGAILMGLAITAVGAGAISPFVVSGDVLNLLNAAPFPSIDPDWLWPVSIALAGGLGALLVRPQRLVGVAMGGVLAGSGWLIGRLPDLLPGVGMAALVAAGLGAGLLAAMLVDVDTQPAWRWLTAWAGVLALLAPVAVTLAEGRAGLPQDRWSKALAFVDALSGEEDPGRVMLIGPASVLPGSSRSYRNLDYRLIDGGVLTIDQAYLPAFGPGDAALEEVLASSLIEGVDLRPGEALAAFGVRWLVVLPGAGLSPEVLGRQVDLAERPLGPDLDVYENLAATGRAVTDAGQQWLWTGRSYHGQGSPGRVRLADSANARWGPEWAEVDGWANSVSSATGEAVFQTDPLTRAAGIASLGLILTLLAAGWWGRAVVSDPQAGRRRDAIKDPLVHVSSS